MRSRLSAFEGEWEGEVRMRVGEVWRVGEGGKLKEP